MRHIDHIITVFFGIMGFIAIGLSVGSGCKEDQVRNLCEARDLVCAKETLRLERDNAACKEVLHSQEKRITDLEAQLQHTEFKRKDSAFECMKLCGGFSAILKDDPLDPYDACKEKCRYEPPEGEER